MRVRDSDVDFSDINCERPLQTLLSSSHGGSISRGKVLIVDDVIIAT